jgi:DNA-directed RNA polymerase subunit RPC12/RpoP
MSAPFSRACAFGLFVAILVVGVNLLAPSVRAAPSGVQPTAAMTVTVILNKADYLSGDTATANAVVYRTPAPTNYTYTWTVRDTFFRVLNTTSGTASFSYAIPLNYTGWINVDARVDDGQGLVVTGRRTATVSVAAMSLRLDRAEFNPGETITASYSVTSHVIQRPTYDYEVDDAASTIILSGTTNLTSFAFQTPNPASTAYRFHVTAREGANSTTESAVISQTSGAFLGVTFDKASYVPGDIIHGHLSVTPRGTTALPIQFSWTLSIGLAFAGAPTASAITTTPETDLFLQVPQGLGSGDLLIVATESNTGTFQYRTVHIGTSGSGFSTEIGGVPLYAIGLGLLFVLLLVAVLGLWRRMGGGHLMGPRSAPPPPGSEPVHAPATAPMSILCKRCGKSIDLTTSKRPIEVMCPSCGETQLVT